MKQKTELGNERKEKRGWLSAVVSVLPEGHLLSLPDHSEGSIVHDADTGIQTDLTSIPVGHLLITSETKVGATSTVDTSTAERNVQKRAGDDLWSELCIPVFPLAILYMYVMYLYTVERAFAHNVAERYWNQNWKFYSDLGCIPDQMCNLGHAISSPWIWFFQLMKRKSVCSISTTSPKRKTSPMQNWGSSDWNAECKNL